MVNSGELAALIKRIGAEQPGEVRLCCPRGHFIVTVAIVTIVPGGLTAAIPLMLVAAVGRDHTFAKRPILIDPSPEQLAQLDAGNPNFVLGVGRNGNPTVTLSCRRCHHWNPVYDYQRLAVHVAMSALAGHEEHRIAP